LAHAPEDWPRRAAGFIPAVSWRAARFIPAVSWRAARFIPAVRTAGINPAARLRVSFSARYFLTLLLVASSTMGCHQVSAPTGPAPKDPPQASPPSTALLTGTLSCSGRGCHADFERPDVKDQSPSRFSYTRWLHQDPHTRAYQVLFEPLAIEIGKKLGIANVGEEPRCLVCHCTPLAARNDPIAVEERTFGVGCEACHGPAHQWLVPHRDAAWQKMKPAEKQLEYARVGMNWLQGQSERALVCAGCHIGAPANNANGLPARAIDGSTSACAFFARALMGTWSCYLG